MKELVKDKKILFITTKNMEYIRNAQEFRIIREVADSVEVITSDKKNYLFRILNVWSQITKKRVKRNDLVFIGFEPQFVLPFVGVKFRGKPVVIDFFISVYDTLIYDRKKFKKGGLLSKFSHWMDEKTLRKADHVITDTKAHADYFISEFGGDWEKIETIYLEADPELYYPRPQNKPERIKEKCVVLYFGSVLPLQGVDIVLGAIRKLKNDNDIYFDIIGPIPDKYNKPIQENVHYTEWLPQDELAVHIANADICLAGHFSGEIDKAWRTIPGKAYIYEMMRKPMILGDGAANHEFFEDDIKHKFVKMGDCEMLAKEIETLLNAYMQRKDKVQDT